MIATSAELCALLDQPQSLVSVSAYSSCGKGRSSTRRSSADGRAAYYSVDLAHCRKLLVEVGICCIHASCCRRRALSLVKTSARPRQRASSFSARGTARVAADGRSVPRARNRKRDRMERRQPSEAAASQRGRRPCASTESTSPAGVRNISTSSLDSGSTTWSACAIWSGKSAPNSQARTLCTGAFPILHTKREMPPSRYPAYQRVARELAGRVQFLGELIDRFLSQEDITCKPLRT